jgi:hypothetical protein
VSQRRNGRGGAFVGPARSFIILSIVMTVTFGVALK